jgi:4-hydroxy-tetrahydrodipicolinate synthase
VLVEQNRGRLPVVIGTGAATREQAARFAVHAREIGASAVIAMPPHIRRRPLSEEVILDYYRGISEGARLPVFIQNYSGTVGTEMSAEFLLRLCREIEHVEYIKEETEPSTIKLTEIIRGNDGSVRGCFGGAGGRYLIEEYRRGTAGNMPGCHMTDVIVSLWQELESGNEAEALQIYKEMAPLFFFEAQVDGCYKEVLFRRGVIACPRKRNGTALLDEISSQYLDDILRALEPRMSFSKPLRAASGQ